MLLTEIFGNNSRVRILEELISKEEIYLTVDEIARMADVSKKTVYTHIAKLDQIGLVVKKEGKKDKYKLNDNDPRAIALGIIENEEFLRKDNESFDYNIPTLDYSIDTTFFTETLEVEISSTDSPKFVYAR
ncbi:MAG: winged helix-turn-helix domain-containing protein [Methanobrevibacter sp.]|nr:winged helix-turn-helix domain-containing protein [Methanobrevibacter sp.]